MKSLWLIERGAGLALAQARRNPLTSEQIAEIVALARVQDSSAPRILKVAGDTAEIAVLGVLTAEPDPWARMYGGGNTSYPDIISSLVLAQNDPAIKRVVLNVNSPGGEVDGLFETLAALESFTKPMEARATNALSAAYGIASKASKITATMPSSSFGSVGVAARYFVDESEITITSTEAPNKRPDVTTPEGQAVVRKELDDLHDLFAASIARGRKTDEATVNSAFGRGAVMLAAEAKKLGMIDGVSASAVRAVPSASGDTGAKETRMDPKKLRADHPEVYEAVVAEGVKQERDRVTAHLVLGEASGDVKIALDAIKTGEEMTTTATARYMAAGMNRKDRTTRQTESDAAAAAAAGATADEGAGKDDSGDKLAAHILKQKKGV